MSDYTQAVANLKNQGMTYAQIGNYLGISKSYVGRFVRAAKDAGLTPDDRPYSKSDMALHSVASKKFDLRYGRIGDVTAGLDRQQLVWLCQAAEGVGCETLAEYLLELVRDEHARAMKTLAERDVVG